MKEIINDFRKNLKTGMFSRVSQKNHQKSFIGKVGVFHLVSWMKKSILVEEKVRKTQTKVGVLITFDLLKVYLKKLTVGPIIS